MGVPNEPKVGRANGCPRGDTGVDSSSGTIVHSICELVVHTHWRLG